MQRNTLYELRTSHPIVDALGYLHQTDDTYWLVFIQISLQRYEDHRSLCDLFKRAPKNSKVRCNMSLFTYYKHLLGIGSSFQNILLLYVSPTAKDVNSLSKLKQQISELNDKNLEVRRVIRWISNRWKCQSYFYNYFVSQIYWYYYWMYWKYWYMYIRYATLLMLVCTGINRMLFGVRLYVIRFSVQFSVQILVQT